MRGTLLPVVQSESHFHDHDGLQHDEQGGGQAPARDRLESNASA